MSKWNPFSFPLLTLKLQEIFFPESVKMYMAEKGRFEPRKPFNSLAKELVGLTKWLFFQKTLGCFGSKVESKRQENRRLAEREGFEPSIRYNRIPDFESGAFDHSATFPMD